MSGHLVIAACNGALRSGRRVTRWNGWVDQNKFQGLCVSAEGVAVTEERASRCWARKDEPQRRGGTGARAGISHLHHIPYHAHLCTMPNPRKEKEEFSADEKQAAFEHLHARTHTSSTTTAGRGGTRRLARIRGSR
jgi:hypothetical protein